MRHQTMRTILQGLAVALLLVQYPCVFAAETEGEPFDYFQNSWNVIALKDYADGTRVTPDNELMLSGQRKLKLYCGSNLNPLSRLQTKTCMDGWLPILLLTSRDGDVRYDFTLWATPLPTVENWRKAYNWPSEGENFLNWVVVKATNTGSESTDARFEVDHIDGAKTKPQSFDWTLKPGASAKATIRVPFTPVRDGSVFDNEDPDVWLERTVDFWHGLMAKATKIRVPCRKATEALYAAHVCQAIANDNGELHGGEGFYDNFYIRDGGYQIMQLEEAGLWDMVDQAIKRYLRSQRPDGRFESQKGQFDANGQGMWVLWQYYKITGDLHWLKDNAYPAMLRAADWIRKARRETPADSPFAGVLPNAIADGECLWEGKNHILGYDFWNLRGLLCTADAANALGQTDEANELLNEAAEYRAAIDKAWEHCAVPHFPPSWEGAGTHWGNTETLWPTELFARDDPRITASLREVRDNHDGGFLEGTIRWTGKGDVDAIHPYMSSYSTMASLMRGEHEKFVEEFYWYLLHTTATHAFPEGIYHDRRYAWSETIPHVTGASNYALLLRHMLLHERGDELHLLLGVPDWWLADGEAIEVERAPTHFGSMSLRIRGVAQGVEVRIDPPRRQRPKRIVLHLPRSRPLVGPVTGADGVEVVTRSEQGKRWDFPAVVDLYLKDAPDLE